MTDNESGVASALTLNHAAKVRERWFLRILAGLTLAYLVTLSVACIWAILAGLSQSTSDQDSMFAGLDRNAVLCVVAGTLGSCVRAIRSVVERVAYGWELSDGTPLPQEKPKGKFGARLVPGFLIRPVLGAAVGLVAYLGILGGALVLVTESSPVELSLVALTFSTFVTGLFAKTFLDRLFTKVPK